jgi:hypothetical protein
MHSYLSGIIVYSFVLVLVLEKYRKSEDENEDEGDFMRDLAASRRTR